MSTIIKKLALASTQCMGFTSTSLTGLMATGVHNGTGTVNLTSASRASRLIRLILKLAWSMALRRRVVRTIALKASVKLCGRTGPGTKCGQDLTITQKQSHRINRSVSAHLYPATPGAQQRSRRRDVNDRRGGSES